MIPTLIDRRWSVLMPEERALRPGWPHWEETRLAYMHAVIRPGDVVWEIGAEQGDISVLYALWGARLILVEPDEACWPKLNAIFAANSVTDSVDAQYAVAMSASGRTLDWLLRVSNTPDVVSMDIEGAEYQALLGADRLLNDIRPILFISVHPEQMRALHGDTPDDIVCHLEKHGYDGEYLGYDHEQHWIWKPRPGWAP